MEHLLIGKEPEISDGEKEEEEDMTVFPHEPEDPLDEEEMELNQEETDEECSPVSHFYYIRMVSGGSDHYFS